DLIMKNSVPTLPRSGDGLNLPKGNQTVKHYGSPAFETKYSASRTGNEIRQPSVVSAREGPGLRNVQILIDAMLAFEPEKGFPLAANGIDKPDFNADTTGHDPAIGQRSGAARLHVPTLGDNVDEPVETVA